MRKTVLLLTVCCALIACNKNKVEFTYSPEAPRAGEVVTFSNQSTSGEEWEWSFGDGATSSLRSPNHIFKKPGTYIVTLKVDKKKAWMASKQITVYDTIPTYTVSDSTFCIYKDYTFTANVYNPYNYEVAYSWALPQQAVYSSSSADESSVKLYFTRAGEASVGLRVVLNGDTTFVKKTLEIQDQATNSILFRTSEGDYRQRIFGTRQDDQVVKDPSAAALLDAEQDTAQVYNGYTFTLSEIAAVFPDIEGFHIASRKIYYRAGGLWVANIDGANIVQIDSVQCAAMTLDTYDNRIYWANKNGVWYMPFVGSDNNMFVTEPVQLNALTDVTKIAPDYNQK